MKISFFRYKVDGKVNVLVIQGKLEQYEVDTIDSNSPDFEKKIEKITKAEL